MATYRWKAGSRVKGVDAEVAYQELEAIRHEYGRIEPGFIVDRARPEDAPLHDAFDWDDFRAGEAYRHDQARRLTRALVKVVGKREPIRVYAHVPEGQDGGYHPMTAIVRSPDQFTLALIGYQKKVSEAQAALDELIALAQATGQDEKTVSRLRIAVEAMVTARIAVEGMVA